MSTYTPEQQAVEAAMWIRTLVLNRRIYMEETGQKPKQGRKRLGNATSGFCCLGFGAHMTGTEYSPLLGYNPDFRRKVGLLHSDGRAVGDNFRALVVLNDNANWTLRRIGQHLYKHPHQYFEAAVADLLVPMLAELEKTGPLGPTGVKL